ncbi:hypothetical protein Lal_00034834 [Lupinus albus]|nr:hypothetical protein Lal_00034834 [Lupinus albus]
MWSLLENLELMRARKVIFHHVDEAIVVFDGASWILHQKCSGFSEAAAEIAAEGGEFGTEFVVRFTAGNGEIRRQIYHR